MAAASNPRKNTPQENLACPSIASPSARQCFPDTLGDGVTTHSTTHLREPTVLCGYNQEHSILNKTCSVYGFSKGREPHKANILVCSKQSHFTLLNQTNRIRVPYGCTTMGQKPDPCNKSSQFSQWPLH